MSNNICDTCGSKLKGLSWDYGVEWTCSNCIEDKTDVLHCEQGDKVIVHTLEAGWDTEREEAKKTFEKGDIYTVDAVCVGSWSSTIYLDEFPDKEFNTVFFKRYDPKYIQLKQTISNLDEKSVIEQ